MKPCPVTSYPSLATKRRAFTLIELLVVIAVIAVLLAVSYSYTPQSTHSVKLRGYRDDTYAYEAAFKLSALNNRAVLALDWIALKDDNPRNMHQDSGGRGAGGNILYGDGSVRFRPIQENEKEHWEEYRTVNDRWWFRGALYLLAQ